MSAARSLTFTFLLALGMAMNVNAALWTNPVKQSVDQAVQDAVSKILQGFGSVANNVGETVQATQNVVGAVAQPVVQAVGQMSQQVVNDYSAMGQSVVNHYNNLGQQYMNHLTQMGGFLGGATDNLDALVDAYSAQFCSPASFAPSVKKPAKFVGPSIALELVSGRCAFNETIFLATGEKVLNCTEPFIQYTKSPANFTSKFKSAPRFRGKQCVISKEFGQELVKVLYVFDGQNPVDPAQIANQIVGEMKNLLGGVINHLTPNSVQTQMQQFLGGLNLKNNYPGMTGR